MRKAIGGANVRARGAQWLRSLIPTGSNSWRQEV